MLKQVPETMLDGALESMAGVLRKKNKSSALIPWTADGFSDAFEKIKTNEEADVVRSDVVFIDYDGSILYSYTLEEFLELSALPPNPDHTGDLIPRVSLGWNWPNLAEAKQYACQTGGLIAGQMYTTVDGRYHYLVRVYPASTENGKYPIALKRSSNDSLQTDWGDGTTDTKMTHEYSSHGVYHVASEDKLISSIVNKEPCPCIIEYQYPMTLPVENAMWSNWTTYKVNEALLCQLPKAEIIPYGVTECAISAGKEIVSFPSTLVMIEQSPHQDYCPIKAVMLPDFREEYVDTTIREKDGPDPRIRHDVYVRSYSKFCEQGAFGYCSSLRKIGFGACQRGTFDQWAILDTRQLPDYDFSSNPVDLLDSIENFPLIRTDRSFSMSFTFVYKLIGSREETSVKEIYVHPFRIETERVPVYTNGVLDGEDIYYRSAYRENEVLSIGTGQIKVYTKAPMYGRFLPIYIEVLNPSLYEYFHLIQCRNSEERDPHFKAAWQAIWDASYTT